MWWVCAVFVVVEFWYVCGVCMVCVSEMCGE